MRNNTPLSNVRFVPYKKNSSSNSWEKREGGPIILRELNAHWMDSLIPSPNKKDVVFVHVKGPGMHYYVSKDTTTALYKHALHQYPLRRGV